MAVVSTAALLSLQSDRSGAVGIDPVIIGNAVSIVEDVRGILGIDERPIELDAEVYFEELVKTGIESAARLQFEDETELVIAERSAVTLDRYIYDPERNTGELALDAVSGAFSFATGKMPPDSYEVDTPFATLAVRGTTIAVNIEDELVFVVAEDSDGIPSAITARTVDDQIINRIAYEGLFTAEDGSIIPCSGAECPGFDEDLLTSAPPTPPTPLDSLLIDLPVVAPRPLEAQSGGPLRAVFSDGSVLEVAAGGLVEIASYTFNARDLTGALRLTVRRGAFTFSSGLMPEGSYEIDLALGEIELRGTTVTGTTEAITVVPAQNLVEVNYDDGTTLVLDEQTGATGNSATTASTCIGGGGCGAGGALDTIVAALEQTETIEEIEPEAGPEGPDGITIQTLDEPDGAETVPTVDDPTTITEP